MGRLLLADGIVDLDRAEIVRGGSTSRLTGAERELLAYLAERAGRDVGRDELHAQVWGHAPHVVSRAADFAVHRLRRKLEAAPEAPIHLLTAPGGYRWVPAAPAAAAPPIGTVLLAVIEPVEPGDGQWLDACARCARDAGAYLAELAPDRAVLAAAELDVARAAIDGIAALAPARVGLARGPAGCLIDPVSGRTLYGGPTLARAGRSARAAAVGVAPTAPDDGGAAPRRPPSRLDRFVGRAELLDALIERFRAGENPLALTGPAGAGKSRLAEELAARVDLVPTLVRLDDATAIEDALDRVLRAVAVPGGPDPVGAIEGALAGRPGTVLILDGVDHLAAAFAEPIRRWSAVGAVFATSRDRGIAPDAVDVAGLDVDDGVALLCDRVAHLTPSDGLRSLVAALDGLPLALELCAPRLRVLGLDGTAAARARLLDLLARGDGAERHRSVRAALVDGWDALDPQLRQTLARASVFASTFDLAEAEAVCALGPPAPWFVDALQALCDRHWVEVTADGGDRRYRLLAVVRAFVRERVDAEPALAGDAVLRHATWFAALVERIPAFGRPGFDVDRFDDLAAAVRASVERGWPALAGAAAYAAATSTLSTRAPGDALALIDLARAVDDGRWGPRLTTHRARLLVRDGRYADALGEAEIAEAAAVDPEQAGRAALQVGIACRAVGRTTASDAAFDRAEAAFRRLGSAVGLELVAINRAISHHERGDLAAALAVATPLLGSPRGAVRAWSSGVAGMAAVERGEVDEAIRWLSASARDFEAEGDVFQAENSRQLLATAHASIGAVEDARAGYRRNLGAMRALGATSFVVVAATKLAALELTVDDVAAAARWLEEAEPWIERCQDQRIVGALRAVTCEVRARAGEPERAARAGDEAYALLSACDDALSLAHLGVHRGFAAVAGGDVERARATLADVEARAAQLEVRPTSVLASEVRRLRRACARTGVPEVVSS